MLKRLGGGDFENAVAGQIQDCIFGENYEKENESVHGPVDERSKGT